LGLTVKRVHKELRGYRESQDPAEVTKEKQVHKDPQALKVLQE